MNTPFANALAKTATRWGDPDHPPRVEATAALLASESRFTVEGIAFAVNHVMDVLASGRLAIWIGQAVDTAHTIAVVTAARAPMEGVLESAAAALAGHRVRIAHQGRVAELLASFLDEVQEGAGDIPMEVATVDAALASADAIIGTGTREECEVWRKKADDVAPERRFGTYPGYGVALLDGRESRADLSGLAEDAWLHDGTTLNNVRLVWAPADLAPDAALDVFASFRETFPAHPTTPGSLSMPAAFLAAAGQPHATGPGFLVSKGQPEPQAGAHLRWVPYDNLKDVIDWLASNPSDVGFVAARASLQDSLRGLGAPAAVPLLAHGDAHRPVPGQPPLTEAFRTFLLRK